MKIDVKVSDIIFIKLSNPDDLTKNNIDNFADDPFLV